MENSNIKTLDDLLESNIPEKIVEEYLAILEVNGQKLIEKLFLEYQYEPKDPPKARRAKISKTAPVTTETLVRFLVFVMMRGSNPLRCFKGLAENKTIQITAIFSQMKVKKFASGGIWSSWQWMTSFWDYSAVIFHTNQSLQNKLFSVGGFTFVPALPAAFYVVGGAHLARVFETAEVKIQIINEIFRYIHFNINIKNYLGKKPVADSKLYKDQRIKQQGFMLLQCDDSYVNFTIKEVMAVWNSIKLKPAELDMKKLADLGKGHNWVDNPYAASIGDYAAGAKAMV
jgi:hypothetical protein